MNAASSPVSVLAPEIFPGSRRWAESRVVLICCHDAGGAEILSDWALVETGKRYHFLLEGPALAVFRRKLGDLATLTRADLEGVLTEVDFVLTGTGWASTLELDCLAAARSAGVFSAAYLDHWVNYFGRFEARGVRVLPDEIWTGDAEAFALAKTTFSGLTVRQQPNPYFDRIRRDFAQATPLRRKDEARLLYVCEPIAIDCVAATVARVEVGYTEFDALVYFLDRVSALAPDGMTASIRVRQHPSEKPGKYEPVLARYRDQLAIEVSHDTTLLDDCRWSTDVIGCGSMAMVVALLGGRRVYSSIPLAGIPCPLPFKAIRYLRDLKA